jgi:hypothetical protein
LLELNLEVVLEKVRAQGNEIQSLRKEVAANNPGAKGAVAAFLDFDERQPPLSQRWHAPAPPSL